MRGAMPSFIGAAFGTSSLHLCFGQTVATLTRCQYTSSSQLGCAYYQGMAMGLGQTTQSGLLSLVGCVQSGVL